MVIRLVACLLLCSAFLTAQSVRLPPKVSVSFPSTPIYETDDITGIITIVHTPDQKVENNSFTINGVPLAVAPIKKAQENVPEGLVVSRYQFTIPKRKSGLYLFPAVEVRVGGMTVASISVSFEVLPTLSSKALRLEARLGSTPPFYPEQRVTFEYRIYFQEPIELIREELPLLFATGFRNAGAPKITSYIQGSDTVQQISQEVVCLSPGTFQIKPSRIEGYTYKISPSGERIRTSSLLRADAPGYSITVQPFPEKGKPASFTGALGQFDWRARLVSPMPVAVGDEVTVELVVSGTGELRSVLLPDIAKQPGFSAFRFSDIPVVGEIEEGAKRFTLQLRPLSAESTTIPSMEFSSFDPFSQSYIIKKTPAIPLTLKAGGSAAATPPKQEKTEIYGNLPVTQSELQRQAIEPTILFVVAFGLLALCCAQIILKKILFSTKETVVQSRELLYRALQVKHKPEEACALIQRALLLRLHEVKYTHDLVKIPQELREDGIEGDVRRFLLTIDQKRFGGLELDREMQEIIKEASELYYRLS